MTPSEAVGWQIYRFTFQDFTVVSLLFNNFMYAQICSTVFHELLLRYFSHAFISEYGVEFSIHGISGRSIIVPCRILGNNSAFDLLHQLETRKHRLFHSSRTELGAKMVILRFENPFKLKTYIQMKHCTFPTHWLHIMVWVTAYLRTSIHMLSRRPIVPISKFISTFNDIQIVFMLDWK